MVNVESAYKRTTLVKIILSLGSHGFSVITLAMKNKQQARILNPFLFLSEARALLAVVICNMCLSSDVKLFI